MSDQGDSPSTREMGTGQTPGGNRVYSGRYELHSRLGRGGMAEVFLARDQLLDRPVAVKVMFQEFAGDPSFVERFRREAQAAANLNHPNVVGVYDWGEEDGTYFIVMEYVDGRSLADILRSEGPLHPDRAADLATDIADALGLAHRNGMVHRDVKPGNVLVGKDGQVKVADFGIARAFAGGTDSELTQAGTVMGTATYFSPEQAQGKPVDPRSDLYALGVVLYEMVAGQPPFTGESPVAIAYQHVREQPVPITDLNPQIPPEIDAITGKLLQKDPSLRYPSAADLRADLRRFREGRTLAAPAVVNDAPATVAVAPVTAAEPSSEYDDGYEEPARRTGVFLFFLILLLLALGGALLFLATQLREDDAATVQVPSVVGQPQEVAEQNLRALGLLVRVETRESTEEEAGNVLEQDPAAGADVDEGEEVTLIVGAGPEPVAVPDVVGQPLEQAQATLEGLGFVVTTEQREVEDDEEGVEPGTVLEQAPAAGQELTPGETVNLVVAQEPDALQVPNVVGQSSSQAGATLGSAGCSVGQTTRENSVNAAADVVIRQSPAAGTEIPEEECTVNLVVSGGQPTPTPTPQSVPAPPG